MPFPTGWPPRPASGVRSIRFFTSGTTTANFNDNAFLFIDGSGANPFTPLPNIEYGSATPMVVPAPPQGTGAATVASGMVGGPVPLIWSGNIRICNDGASPLQFSFDGTNVHGVIRAAEVFMYRNRYEAGISLRYPGGGAGSAFRVEAW